MHIPSMKSDSCGLRLSCSCCESSALAGSSAYMSVSSDVGTGGWFMKRACCLQWRVVMGLVPPTPWWCLRWWDGLELCTVRLSGGDGGYRGAGGVCTVCNLGVVVTCVRNETEWVGDRVVEEGWISGVEIAC